MRTLMKEKRKLKEQKRKESTQEQKDIIHKRISELKEIILEEESNQKYRRLIKTTENISKGGKLDSGGFWKLQKTLKSRNRENAHAVINAEGNKVSEPDAILKAYKEFYENLLTTTNKTVEESKDDVNVTRVNESFRNIMNIGINQEARQLSNEQITKAMKRLKKKKAKDKDGWYNELLLEGGEEMITSLRMMFNEILQLEITPEQWKIMMIISIHKKGLKELLSNKRGLFLTNVISKLFEKVLEDLIGLVQYDEFQAGGCKGKGGLDNWFILMAVRDEGKRL